MTSVLLVLSRFASCAIMSDWCAGIFTLIKRDLFGWRCFRSAMRSVERFPCRSPMGRALARAARSRQIYCYLFLTSRHALR
jgi:hypothetical protein